MTYVVTDACIKCKYMDCVEVCPVDCLYEGEVMLVIERFGGRFLVRGGTLHPLEGEPDFLRLVIIEFADLDAARRFYDSAEYQALIPHRTDNARSMLLIAEGV